MVLKIKNQRMAHARTNRQARHLCERISRTDEKGGAPFVQHTAVWKDLFFAAFILLAVAECAAWFGPFWSDRQARSDDHPDRSAARLLFPVAIRQVLSLLPPSAPRLPRFLVGPVLVIGGLITATVSLGRRRKELAAQANRGVDGAGDRHQPRHVHPSRRLRSVEPKMNAWSGDPVPARFLAAYERAGTAGAACIPGKQCRNCHSLEGRWQRAERPGPRQRRRTAHSGSAHPASDPGRRQHARNTERI